MKKLSKAVAALLLVGVPIASVAATITIDFEEFAYGSSVGSYYNHGKDSLNRASGSYYGITFGGGTVKSTPTGAYLAGATTLTIDPAAVRAILGTDKYYITYNAGVYYQRDEREVRVTFEDGFSEPYNYIPGNASPDCRESNGCVNQYYGTMGGYGIFGGIDYAMAVKILFPTDRLDNLQIHSWSGSGPVASAKYIPGTYDLSRDIPEPASLALLGIGAVALMTRRRRKSHKIDTVFY